MTMSTSTEPTMTVSRALLTGLADRAAALLPAAAGGDAKTFDDLVDLAADLARAAGTGTDDPATDLRVHLAELRGVLADVTGGDPADAGLAEYARELVDRCGVALAALEVEKK